MDVLQAKSDPFHSKIEFYTSMMDPKCHHYPLEMKFKSPQEN